ncbi:3-deoxy-manno-octulosonate cytidylyltransferase [bacterium]|nr:3-deoxy-manno-octulosonate cytidylyltransferase [bacterium]
MQTRCQIVLPARLASSRLAEKLLRKAGGKTILHHTYEAASRSSFGAELVVAVDHPKLAKEVDAFGGRWVMTSENCVSGTDRLAEVAKALPSADIFINVQADEPEIDPASIDLVARTLLEHNSADMATVGTPIRDRQQLEDPACVKILMSESEGQGRAVYFSRAALPFVREGVKESHLRTEPPIFWHHIGLYAYRREFLSWFASQPPSQFEQLEKLEQLRAIEAGKHIVVARVNSATPGIDTLDDFQRFERKLGD